MTVGELIEKLQQLDKSSNVTVYRDIDEFYRPEYEYEIDRVEDDGDEAVIYVL